MWFEKIECGYVYSDIDTLFNSNRNLKTEEAIIFLVNTNSGFGSQLTLLVQNSLYLKNMNPKLHCLGHFSRNSNHFKYHITDCKNSFFRYFEYLNEIPPNVKYYFVNCNLLNCPFVQPQIVEDLCVDNIAINKYYSSHFKKNFRVKIESKIGCLTDLSDNTTPLIGIHMRSLYQTNVHSFGRDLDSAQKRFLRIKCKLDEKFPNYNVFIVTDVSFYLETAKEIFGKERVYFNDFISRVDTENEDSVINMDEHTGFKLGSDIIYDCQSLVNCDFYYVSITNIAFICSFISDKENTFHFN